METLAYLHLALSFEECVNFEVDEFIEVSLIPSQLECRDSYNISLLSNSDEWVNYSPVCF